MKSLRVEKVLTEMKKQNISQAIISDPVSIFYLTDLMLHPGERLFALLLDENNNHKLFVNALFPIKKDLGIEKVIFTDTDNSVEVLQKHLIVGTTLGKIKFFLLDFYYH